MFTVMDYQSAASELKPVGALKVGNQFYNLKRVDKDQTCTQSVLYGLNHAKPRFYQNGQFETQ